jgi:hypothetical protein
MKLQYQTILQFEVDTETGKNRVLKSFTTPLGQTAANKYKKTVKKAVEVEKGGEVLL